MDCLRCGNCCRADMSAYVTREDINMWRSMNRDDLIKEIDDSANIWAGDQIMTPDGNIRTECRFYNRSGAAGSCSIYEARPAVCRNFAPGESLFCPRHAGYNLIKRN